MKKLLPILFLLWMTPGCLSLWPWMRAVSVIETEEEPVRQARPQALESRLPFRNYRTRAFSDFEKQFDTNHNGFLEGEELIYYRQAKIFRKQEKQLRGEK